MQNGEYVEAIRTTPRFQDEWESAYELRDIVRELGEIADKASHRPAFEEALNVVSQIKDGKWRAELLYLIAAPFAEMGDRDTCRATFSEAIRAVADIDKEDGRADLLTKIAIVQAEAGFPGESILTAQRIQTEIHRWVPEIAATLVALGDKEHFKRLLSACAYYPEAAKRMCRLLIQLYREQSAEVATAVMAACVNG